MEPMNQQSSGQPRTARVQRETRETRIDLSLTLDGTGNAAMKTGLGFLDHMLTSLACHSGMDIHVACVGDLQVDDHHSVEDCAIALGEAFSLAMGERIALERFGSSYAPLDEALARCVVDLVRRPHASIALGLTREKIGDVACENLHHFFESFALSARITLHVDVLKGINDHHRAEAAFKAFALALRQAIKLRSDGALRSTKGTL
jgi:imidazoleglycerol phosphate dehydratase HisB